MKVKVNDSLITDYTFKEFSFDESRYINSHMDYALNIKEKEEFTNVLRKQITNFLSTITLVIEEFTILKKEQNIELIF